MKIENRIKGSYYGAIIGDQTGQVLEFKKRESQYYKDYNEMLLGMRSGMWTDDTSMTLCLMDSLTRCNGIINQKDLLDTFMKWYEEAYLTVNKKPYDCGMTVSERLLHYKDTGELESPYDDEMKSGNGSLMRIAPTAYLNYDNFEKLKEDTIKSALTTHSATKTVNACLLQNVLIAQAIRGVKKEDMKSIFNHSLVYLFENRYNEVASNIFGYVVDSLDIALTAFFTTDNFNDGLIKSINYGGDTDTNASIYGQLAGAYYGYEGLDKNFLELIRDKEVVDNIFINFNNKLMK